MLFIILFNSRYIITVLQKAKRKIGSDSEDEGVQEEGRGSEKEEEGEEKPPEEGEGAEGGEGREAAVLPNISDEDSDNDRPSNRLVWAVKQV